ncbi:Acyl transferase domain-containing protein [Micromonospora matsumotoense]|uniref:Acyl transferase domain-containing protein n=1 Tax=Micromonospora matsumotoense TaxID=121616 RepID=A0A1C5AWU8_9ACTN|nr:type I polyketide synthase [Micromonospora matsumotoense]SCF49682.1 Acyl transferase domain-containing protein [Micromonospora matsumotoense]
MEAKEQLRALLLERYEPIAVVGVGLRLPGGNDTLDAFIDFLSAGRSATVPIPADRWDAVAYAHPGRGGIATTAGGFLEGLDRFDARFFNISPKEANCMDPQQRLVLETAWEALEHAGIDPTSLRHGDGGVYLGAGSMDYAFELGELPDHELDGHLSAGVAHSAVSGRLSYVLGWRGPSMTVDTACSASLVALHLAVQGLRRRECGIALCGGVNAIHHPRTTALFGDMNALAPDGTCKTFDERADGYGRAEGCGMLVLKRMSDARRDGDTVLGLIRGTAVGHDGESAGLTAPNGTAQEALMRRALAAANLTPGDVQYVEAHGTGTPLGDPIELGAIGAVYADSHTAERPVLVGSVKTNIGHLELAAGVGGVLKVLAQLRASTVFPHLNLTEPSSRIPWSILPVDVPREHRPWPGPVRRAMVNSFGFAGTIASAVVEQAPPVSRPQRPPSGPGVLTLSAKSPRALLGQVERLLAAGTEHDIGDLCHTTNVARAHLPYRLAGVVRDHAGLRQLLAEWREVATLQPSADIRKVAFLCTGQGAQKVGMGAELYRRQPVFRRWVDELDALFAPHLGRSVKDLDETLMQRTRYAQPALFTLEYALAQLWLSWGVRPNVLAGHSLGEVTAAAVAGLFSLDDAACLVAARGRLMESVTEPGGMVSVRASAAEVAPLIKAYPDLALAAINAARQCVVSGGVGSLAAVHSAADERGWRPTRLAVSHAFHSPLMAGVLDEFRAELAGIAFHEPKFPLVSAVTGQMARWRQIATVDYWVRHICEPVDFAAAVRTVERRGRHAFLEIGPSGTLIGLARAGVADPAAHAWVRSLHDDDTVLKGLAGLHTAGVAVSWRAVHDGTDRRRVELPPYAFDRQRYWLGETTTADPESEADDGDPVRAVVARVLGFPSSAAVPVDVTFTELGLDSLAAGELVEALGAAVGRPVALTTVYDHPTVRSLSTHLERP